MIEQLTADLLDAQRFIAKLQQVSWCGGWSCGRLPGPARVPCSHCAIARPTRQAQQDSETQIRKLRGLGDYKAAHDRLAKELSQVCMTGVPAIRPCLARGGGRVSLRSPRRDAHLGTSPPSPQSQKQCQSLAAQLQATHSALNHSQGASSRGAAMACTPLGPPLRTCRELGPFRNLCQI